MLASCEDTTSAQLLLARLSVGIFFFSLFLSLALSPLRPSPRLSFPTQGPLPERVDSRVEPPPPRSIQTEPGQSLLIIPPGHSPKIGTPPVTGGFRLLTANDRRRLSALGAVVGNWPVSYGNHIASLSQPSSTPFPGILVLKGSQPSALGHDCHPHTKAIFGPLLPPRAIGSTCEPAVFVCLGSTTRCPAND